MMDGTPDFSTSGNDRDTAIPRFFLQPVQNQFLSDKEGRPIFEDKEYIEIRVPGDRKTEWIGSVKEEHRQRFPRHYAAFKLQQEVPLDGTPISEWAAVTRSQTEELAFAHIKTIEQLAALSDDGLAKSVSMGGFTLREKAQRYLEQAKGNAPMEALAAEAAAQRETIAVLEQQIADLVAASKRQPPSEGS